MTSSDSEDMIFQVLKAAAEGGSAARLGRLAIPQRKAIDTPNFIAITSRGVVPHVTPDAVTKHTQIGGAYMALEDFIEKSQKILDPAIYKTPSKSGKVLHSFTATPSDVFTVLGTRRHPAVLAPMGNGQNFVSVFTSTGFQSLHNEKFCVAVDTLKPDVIIPMADLTSGASVPNAKRQRRMVERTEDWTVEFFRLLDSQKLKASNTSVFAPLLPVSYPIQWEWLNRLSEDHIEALSGLAVYDVDILPDLKDYPTLGALALLSLDTPPSPHRILRQISMGIDILSIPFLNTVSDAGIAFTFSFNPHPEPVEGLQPLGVDMWSPDHQMAVKPLKDGCQCYVCTKHHRAYLHHLLQAKEMLGWTLLQIHNHHVVSTFFSEVRAALATEPSKFEQYRDVFYRVYEAEFPLGTGQRPRARGYHFKAEAGQPKINQPAWKQFDGVQKEDATLAAEAAGLAVTGLAAGGTDTPVVPEVSAGDLDNQGFAEIQRNSN